MADDMDPIQRDERMMARVEEGDERYDPEFDKMSDRVSDLAIALEPDLAAIIMIRADGQTCVRHRYTIPGDLAEALRELADGYDAD